MESEKRRNNLKKGKRLALYTSEFLILKIILTAFLIIAFLFIYLFIYLFVSLFIHLSIYSSFISVTAEHKAPHFYFVFVLNSLCACVHNKTACASICKCVFLFH